MKPITFSMFACSNWCIQTIIAKAFEPGYEKCGAIRQVEKISRPDQKKGG